MSHRIVSKNPANPRLHGLEKMSLRTLATAVCGALGMGLSSQALAAGPSTLVTVANGQGHTLNNFTASNIQTTKNGNSNTINIAPVQPNNSTGSVAFGSYGDFNVAQGDTVNFTLPQNATSVVNLIWGESTSKAAQIDGTVNSYLYGKSGTSYGGAVYFADPNGIVIGASGVLNVGALSLSAPTASFMQNVLIDANNIGTAGATRANLDALLGGQNTVTTPATTTSPFTDSKNPTNLNGNAPTSTTTSTDANGNTTTDYTYVSGNVSTRVVVYAPKSGSTTYTIYTTTAETVNDTAAANACASGNSAMICVDGAIHANNAVRIHATTIDVSGTITVSGAGSDFLATAVNLDGNGAPTQVEQDGNTIRLIAEDSNGSSGGGDAQANAAVSVSGTLSTGNGTYPKSATPAPSQDSWGEIALTANVASNSDYATGSEISTLESAGKNVADGALLMLDQGTFNSSTPNQIIDNLVPSTSQLASDAMVAANVAAGKLGVQVAFARSFSTANVELSKGANINAGGDVLLQSGSTTETSANVTAATTSGSSPLSAAGFYGAVYSKANALVDSGAIVTSGGNVTVKATTDNSMAVTASSTATGSNSVVGATVAWTQAAVDANAQVNGTVTANALNIGAHNSNDFDTEASASTSNASGSGSIGLAGAVSRQTIAADAYLGSAPTINIGAAGNITIAAETDTTKNNTSASTGTTAPTPAESPSPSQSEQGEGGDLTNTMGNVTQNADGSGSGKGLGSDLPFKIGSAVAWTDSSNTATASTAPNLVIATGGNLAIQAIVSNAGIHNGADSETSSAEDAGSEGASSTSGSSGGGSSSVNVSAAVAYANYQNSADAEIGSGDKITAQNIGVNAQVVVPFDFTFGLGSQVSSDLSDLESMGNSLDAFEQGLSDLNTLKSTVKGLPSTIMNGVSGFAGAAGDGSTVTVGGSVNYFGMSNSSRAWVGSGSSLTSTAATPARGGNESWTSSLDWLTGAVNDQNIANSTTPADPGVTGTGAEGSSTFTWSNSVDVLAGTHVAAFNLVGDLAPWADKAAKAAIGGAFNYGGYADSATAGVDSQVAITSNNIVAVNATSADTLFVLSPTSGQGGSAAIEGMVALTDVSDATHATLSGSDTVNASALDVNATNPVMVWSLAGALSKAGSGAVGLSVGINDITTSTVASIGDNSGDEVPAPTLPPAPTPAETGGTITVNSLAVQANTSGEAGGLSVAGSYVSSPAPAPAPAPSPAPAPAPAPGSGLLSMLKGVSSLADKLRGGAETFQSALDKVDEISGEGATIESDLTGSSSSSSSGSSLLDDASSKLSTISSGLSAVSSASSGLQGIVGKLGSLNKKSSGTPSSSSGSSSSSSATFGIGISGAASVDMASLSTQSGVDGVTVTVPASTTAGSPQVDVVSTNDAQLYSAAGSAAIVRAQSGNTNAGIAGTVAYSNVADTTTAIIGDHGSSDATQVNAGNVAVQAVDNSMQVDAGVGVAAALGGSGTDVTLAGSVSIGASHNQTTASIDDATLTDPNGTTTADGVQVTAYDASEIGIGAGALSLSTGSGTNVNGALSLTYAQIKDNTNASVDDGASISNYGNFSLNALDSAQIIAVAATGSLATGGKGVSVTGAVTYSDVQNGTVASVDNGASVNTNGNIAVQAEAVDPTSALVSSLNLPTPQPATSYYDFSGGALQSNIASANSASQNADSNANAQAGLTASTTTSGPNSTGLGSSIIAVAGDVSAASNDVGMSLAYSNIANTHQVVINGASLTANGGTLNLNAQDNTRVIDFALGVAGSAGPFAGLGSATVSTIANHDEVLLGPNSDEASGLGTGATSLSANIINASATDKSAIYSLAGSVGVNTQGVAAGGAVTYNNIGNTIAAEATNVAFTTNGADTQASATNPVYDLGLQASNNASIMAGAVAGSFGSEVALSLSFGWNQTSNTVDASLVGGSLTNLAQGGGSAGAQGTLGITATDNATIQALSGAVAFSGSAGVGAAASVQEIGDSTQAWLQNASLQTNDVTVNASTTATEQSIALGAAIGGDGSGAASVAYNCIGSGGVSDGNCAGSSAGNTGTLAAVSGITGAGGAGAAVIGNTLNVSAVDNSNISTLAVDVSDASGVAVGASVAVSGIGTTTSASIGTAAPASGSDSTLTLLDVGNQTNVTATSSANIESLAVGASGSGDASVAGSASANSIDNTIRASMTNVSTGTAADPLVATSGNVTTIQATNSAQIGSLAGALVDSGSAAVGAAVAVNDINTNTTAAFDGDGGTPTSTIGNVGNWYQTGSLQVEATASIPSKTSGLFGGSSSLASDNANIQTIAVAAGLAGGVGVSGSVAVNQIGGNTSAYVDQDANVVANQNVGVLASSNQGINVYAGAAGLGDSAGVGAGVVVNTLNSGTTAYIDNSDVNAYANGAALSVAGGTTANTITLPDSLTGTLSTSTGTTSNISTPDPDLDSATTSVKGVAVSASNEQHAFTLSVGVGAGSGIAGAAEVGVNQIGGTTSAYIDDGSLINALKDTATESQQSINAAQQVYVNAYNAQYAANYLAAVAASGGIAVSAAAPVNTFNGDTKAYINASTVDSQASQQGTVVQADSYQWSLNNLGAASVSIDDSANLTGAVSLFSASTDAYINGGSISASNVSVLANSAIQSSQIGGALAVSVGELSAAGSGMALVNIDNAETSAEITNVQSFADGGAATVQATSSNTADALGEQLAGGLWAGLAGTAGVDILGNTTTALVQNSTLAVGGTLNVTANDTQNVANNLGGIGIGAAGVGGGVDVTLLQTHVDANIDDSSVTTNYGNAASGVNVYANSALSVNNQTTNIAAGAAGVGVSVGVLIAGSGDAIANNGNLSWLNGGSGTPSASSNGQSQQQVTLADVDQFGSQGSLSGTDANGNAVSYSSLGVNNASAVNSSGNFSSAWATAMGSASNGITARITDGSQITTSGNVNVAANVTDSTSNTAGAGAGGAAAIGVSVAYTELDNQVGALVDNTSKISGASTVAVQAGIADGAGGSAAYTAISTGQSAGNVTVGALGINVAVADSEINNNVLAEDAGNIAGSGTLGILAGDSSTASAGNSNPTVNVGIGVAAGTIQDTADRHDNILASLDAGATASGFASLTVAATDNGGATAQGVAGTGGIISGDGADITASDTSTVSGSIGVNTLAGSSSASIFPGYSIGSGLVTTLSGVGATKVKADAAPTLSASAQTTTIGVGISIGVNNVKATASLDSSAVVGSSGSDVQFTNAPAGSTLNVTSDFAPTLSASSTGNSGGIVAVDASDATASSSGSNRAEIGSGVMLPLLGSVSIVADSTPVASAHANGVVAGGFIGGGFNANASSDETTTASLDGSQANVSEIIRNATTGVTYAGATELTSLGIVADSTDTNDAAVKSGSGELVGGVASTATTAALSSSSATLGANQYLTMGGEFNLVANTQYIYGVTADSSNGAVVGGSGAYANNLAGASGTTAAASIGGNTAVVSGGDLNVIADTTMSADTSNGGATSGAGGLFVGTAAKVDNTFLANNAALIGNGDYLATYGYETSSTLSSINVIAFSTIQNVDDQASITIGGAVPVANPTTNFTGTVGNTIDIDGNSALSSYVVNVGTYAMMGAMNTAIGNSYGLAGVASASSTTSLTASQSVNVGTDGNGTVSIASMDDSYVLAGEDFGDGSLATELNAQPVAQAYVRGLIAIPSASATANVLSNASLTLGAGSSVTSDGDVNIGSINGTLTAHPDSEGHGYELGFIPVTNSDNSTSVGGSANTVINGNVVAGTGGDLLINIDASGNLTSNAIAYAVDTGSGFATAGGTISGTPSAVTFAAQWVNDYNETAPGSTGSVTAWELGGSASDVLGVPLSVRGGNVYLFGGNGTSANTGGISGSGSVMANPAPSITINNASTDTLALSGIDVSFGLSGTVYENNANTSGTTSIGGVSITQAPSDAQPNITVNNTYNGTLSPSQNTPDIMVNGVIQDFGGNVSLSTSEGSITTNGIYANDVSIYAPRGDVTFNANPAFTGGDPAGALDSSASWLFTNILGPDFFNTGSAATGSWDADKVAAAIMESVYAPNSTSTATLNAALMTYGGGTPVPFSNYQGTFQATPIITIGNCAGFSYGGSTCNGSGDSGIGYGVIGEGPGGAGYTPIVPWIALGVSGTNVQGVSSSWGAGQKMPSSQSQTLTVNAGANGYIDFDSSYTVGQSGVWTVQTQTGLNDFLAAYSSNKGTPLYAYNAGSSSYAAYQESVSNGTLALTDGTGNTLYYYNSSNSSFEPLLGLVQSAGSSRLIGASYNLNQKQIDLDSVEATGGGQATLIGHVVSTGGGSITVNSGYGEVLVDNTTGLPLQVNNIDTGKASPGMVTIEDYSQLIGSSKVPSTTWYVSVDGGATQTFTNNPNAYNSAQSGVTSTLEAASNVPSIVEASNVSGDAIYALTENGGALTSYAPAQGQYYNYGMSATVFRPTSGLPYAYTGSSSSTDWSFYNAQTGKAENGDQAWTPYSGFSTSANVALNNGAQWAVGISGSTSNPVQSIYAGGWAVFHGCGGGLGSGCNYGTTATVYDDDTTWYSSKNPGGYGSAWNFLYPDYGRLSINVTQSASLPIAVNFATSTTNRVEIDSNANILLNGVISNTNNPVQNGNTAAGVSALPDTLLVATNGGNILNTNPQQQLIWTHDLAMITEGGGSIGTSSRPINVQITGYGNTDTGNGGVVDTGNETTVVAVTDGYTKASASPDGGNDGSIHLNINSGSSNQPILAVAGGKGTQVYGDVDITSTGSLVSTRGPGVMIPGMAYLGCLPADMASGGACTADATVQGAIGGQEDIVGDAVSLTSQLGSIVGSQTINGSVTSDRPLMVQTHFSAGSVDALNLTAAGDIDVANDAGDYEVGSVVSQHGNVTMDAEKGGIYDASSLSASATLNPTQEEALWQRFGLVSVDTNGNAINGPTAVGQAITSQVNAAYSEYVGLMAEGSYSNGNYTFNKTPTMGLLQSYWALVVQASNGTISASATPDQIDVQNYLASRIAGDISLFGQWISTSSASWNTQGEFTNPGGGYVFALTLAQQQSLASQSWSENALLYSLSSAGMLAAPSTGGAGSGLTTTTVGTNFTPNISGVNVTLLANGKNSGLGQLGTPITIDESDLATLYSTGTLVNTLDNGNNPGVLQALASASTPGDITVYDTNHNVISGQQLAQLAANATLSSVGATAGGTTIGSIVITQIDPLFVDVTGDLAGKANGAVYIQAQGNLALATQQQGDQSFQLTGLSSGLDMNLTATGGIQADPGTAYLPNAKALLSVGGNLTIAANNNVGFDSYGLDALPVFITGTLNKGSAGGNLALEQTAGDLLVNQAVANDDVLLQSRNGSIYSINNVTSVAGNQITFDALDNVAFNSTPTAATPTLGALWVQETGSKPLLYATATNGIVDIATDTGDLNVGTIQSAGEITLLSTTGSLAAQQLTSSDAGVDATGYLDARFYNVQAAGGVVLNATTGALTTTGTIASSGTQALGGSNPGDDVDLNGATGVTIGGDVSTGNGNINATLTNLTDTGTLETGQGAALSATGGNVALSAAQTGDTVQMGSGSSITATGTATITSGGNVVLGLVRSTDASDTPSISIAAAGSIQGNGDTLNVEELAGGSVSLQSVNDIGSATSPLVVYMTPGALDATSTQGSIYINALGNLNAQSISANRNVVLAVADALDFTQITAGGNATLTAATIDGSNLTAGGAVQTNSTGATTLGTVASGGDLTAIAGTDLTATTVSSGGNTALTATSGTLQITGSLTSGGDTALTAGSDIGVNALTVGGTLVSNSGGDTTITQGTVTGSSQFTAGGDLALGDFTGGDNLTAHAAGSIGFGSLLLTGGSLQAQAGGDLDVTQQLNVQQGGATLGAGGNMSLAAVTVADNLVAHAGGTLNAGSLQAGGEATLTAGGAMSLSNVQAGQDLTAQAGGSLQAGTLSAGGNGSLQSGTSMTLGGVTTGGNLDMLAGQQLAFNALDAGGSVSGRSQQAGIQGNSVQAGGSIQFVAPGDIRVGALNAGTDVSLQAGGMVVTQTMAAGNNVTVQSGGDADLYSTTAGNTLDVDSGAAINMHDGTAGHSISLAAQQLGFTWLTAPDSITLLARDGSILGATLTTRDAFVAANGDIQLDAAFIGDRINLQANNISATVTQTTSGQPLYSVLTGYQGGVAGRIVVTADAPQDWMIDRLAAVNAALATTAPNVDISSAHIEQTMSVKTPDAYVWMNEHSAILVPATVQLMQPTYDFQLHQDGVATLTDAFIVRYSFGDDTTTPNYVAPHDWLAPNYLGESALRFNGRMLTDQTDDRGGDQVDQHPTPVWTHTDPSQLVRPVDVQEAAVNINAPE
ncbi:filamentous hemagglutinin N-terminal domain-containing protein [Dyella amyloliquefaciens]|uniref:filamentous hemagglutinin N-terminal domain-containing protein n=1 Tax=Dyella amyloliquefaciens TaxID=1770545 RepID=UPI00102E243B|nr:filamentous hemagglutinin N-terminal domain-containing protein [Dyella amyloliquefaciens]